MADDYLREVSHLGGSGKPIEEIDEYVKRNVGEGPYQAQHLVSLGVILGRADVVRWVSGMLRECPQPVRDEGQDIVECSSWNVEEFSKAKYPPEVREEVRGAYLAGWQIDLADYRGGH